MTKNQSQVVSQPDTRNKRLKNSKAGLVRSLSKQQLVGLDCEVWWDGEQQFFRGHIAEYDPNKDKFVVDYDDGDQDTGLEIIEYKVEDKARKKIVRVLKSRTESSSYLVKAATPSSSSENGARDEASLGEETANMPGKGGSPQHHSQYSEHKETIGERATSGQAALARDTPMLVHRKAEQESHEESANIGQKLKAVDHLEHIAAFEEAEKRGGQAGSVSHISQPQDSLQQPNHCSTAQEAAKGGHISSVQTVQQNNAILPEAAAATHWLRQDSHAILHKGRQGSKESRGSWTRSSPSSPVWSKNSQPMRKAASAASLAQLVNGGLPAQLLGSVGLPHQSLGRPRKEGSAFIPLALGIAKWASVPSWPDTGPSQFGDAPLKGRIAWPFSTLLPQVQVPPPRDWRGASRPHQLPKPITLKPPAIGMKAALAAESVLKRKHRLADVTLPSDSAALLHQLDSQSSLQQASRPAEGQGPVALECPSVEQVLTARRNAEAAAKLHSERLRPLERADQNGRRDGPSRGSSRAPEWRGKSREVNSDQGRHAGRDRYEAIKRDAAARRRRDCQAEHDTRSQESGRRRTEDADREKRPRSGQVVYLSDRKRRIPGNQTPSLTSMAAASSMSRSEDHSDRSSSQLEESKPEPALSRRQTDQARKSKQRLCEGLGHEDDLIPSSGRFKRGRIFVCSPAELDECIQKEVVGGSRPSDRDEVCIYTAIFLYDSVAKQLNGIFCGDDDPRREDCRSGPFHYQVLMRLWRPAGILPVRLAEEALGPHPNPHSRCPIPDLLSEKQVKALCLEYKHQLRKRFEQISKEK